MRIVCNWESGEKGGHPETGLNTSKSTTTKEPDKFIIRRETIKTLRSESGNLKEYKYFKYHWEPWVVCDCHCSDRPDRRNHKSNLKPKKNPKKMTKNECQTNHKHGDMRTISWSNFYDHFCHHSFFNHYTFIITAFYTIEIMTEIIWIGWHLLSFQFAHRFWCLSQYWPLYAHMTRKKGYAPSDL